MKQLVLLALLNMFGMNLFSQNDSILKIIFVPHPRTEDKIKQSVNPAIEQIDFSKFDIKMLGGDLTVSTSKNRATLAYCDSIFDLKNPNTLWGFGNHDVESGNRALIKEFTGRDSYYPYFRENITFLALDAELNANGFNRTFILGDQLQMIKNVCDTISKSRFLFILHSRYIWMINNSYFDTKLDSIAASSKSMDTTNFYSEIYPLLKNVKAKGIQIVCTGGDKSLINVKYSPEDSITFFASAMANTNADSINYVIVFNYNKNTNELTSKFVRLDKVEKKKQDTTVTTILNTEKLLTKVWQGPSSKTINI